MNMKIVDLADYRVKIGQIWGEMAVIPGMDMHYVCPVELAWAGGGFLGVMVCM